VQNKFNIGDLVRPEIKKMTAYHVPEATGMIKLDAMENPFSWSDEMKGQWLEVMCTAEPNRYPDPSAKALVQELRQCFSVDDELGVVLGNGSDELIQLIIMAMNNDACVMAPMPSFVMYQHIAKSMGVGFVGVPLNPDFSLDVSAMLALIKKHDPAVIFLAYPNNPTANLFDDADVLAILEASNGLVVIDEAYQPFAGKSYLDQVKHFDRILVMRTVSKLGLAGLRLGFLVGPNAIVEQFEKIRLPYNINSLTQLTASFAFKHMDVLNQQAAMICEQREELLATLAQLERVEVFPSKANFILFALLDDSAERVFEALKDEGLLIKKMGDVVGLPKNCLRVTVGTADENTLFCKHLKIILS